MPSKRQFCNSVFRATSDIATAALALAIVFALAANSSQSAQAQTFKVLHTFTGGADGARPVAGLIMDRAGSLYGTTEFGGTYGFGIVFRLAAKGSGWILSPLYSFQGISNRDGNVPLARVVIGPDGSLYGTTQFGGTTGSACPQGCGTVFNLKPPVAACKTAFCPWIETVLYRFRGGADGAYPEGNTLLIAPSGIIYGTAGEAGAYGYGVVFSLTPSQGAWTYRVIYSFSGGNDGELPTGWSSTAAAISMVPLSMAGCMT
jgi:uncharacterized repeat protein (TIGR03803 family)